MNPMARPDSKVRMQCLFNDCLKFNIKYLFGTFKLIKVNLPFIHSDLSHGPLVHNRVFLGCLILSGF